MDDKCEIYLEYFPVVPTDPKYPTASEEFPIKFYIRQKDWYEYLVCHLVPWGWTIRVCFRDDCGQNGWVEWKRWYPISMSQSGLTVTWTLGVGSEYLSLSASVQAPPIKECVVNYSKVEVEYNGEKYMRVGFLDVYYDSNNLWGSTYAEGAGSIGIPNDLAQAHIGHHITILVQVTVWWANWAIVPYEEHYTVNFILGDDNPSTTDCWLTVEQGHTNFLESGSRDGGGGGGCPYVYTWDGQQYVMDNNLLPASEMSDGADVEDRYMLEQPLVPTYQSRTCSLYSLQICEFEHEHDFIDQVKLIALDHASDVKIAVTPKGEILTYRQPLAPLSCIDNNGTSRLNEVVSMDGNVSDPATYFEGYPNDYLILNFGKVDAENAKLILRDDMKCCDVCIEVQVPNGSGGWQTVEVLNPRDYWAIEAVNLTAYIPEKGDFTVRLLWTAPHRLDYVGLDTTPQDNFKLHYAILASAIHSTEGNILQKIIQSDDKYAELTPGQSILIIFTIPNPKPGKITDFIFYTEGHYHSIKTPP
ncbi:MAG: hypothetical protein QXN95_04030 [Candidatus Bathyarchaeia archaeon]